MGLVNAGVSPEGGDILPVIFTSSLQNIALYWYETFRSAEECLVTLSTVPERDQEKAYSKIAFSDLNRPIHFLTRSRMRRATLKAMRGRYLDEIFHVETWRN